MTTDDTLCAMALTRLPAQHADTLLPLLRSMGSASHVLSFLNDEHTAQAMQWAQDEWQRMQRHHIQALVYGTPGYPQRLLAMPDAPVVLYLAGSAPLDTAHAVAIVGTRQCTPYGAQRAHQLVCELKERYGEVLIVSGLAEGIDINAHRQALDSHVPTVGVLAHGLHTIYPACHRPDAIHMVQGGGGALLTEYPLGTAPRPGQFLLRNRIIAALADSVVLIESAARGGGLSAIGHARRLHRSCYAWPGIEGKTNSEGCRKMIEKERAKPLKTE